MAKNEEEIKETTEVRAETNNTETSESDDSKYLKFSKPFKWEDKTYDGLDLTKLENVTTGQLMQMKRELNNSGFISSTPELELEYCLRYAAVAMDLPFEFFRALPAKEGSRLRVQVSSFLLNAD